MSTKNIVTKEVTMKPSKIAPIVHELIRSFNKHGQKKGYDVQPAWEDLDKKEQRRIIKAVALQIEKPVNPRTSHARWMKAREKEGWSYGKKLDRANKKHTNFVDYRQLPDKEKIKDKLFGQVIKLISPL